MLNFNDFFTYENCKKADFIELCKNCCFSPIIHHWFYFGYNQAHFWNTTIEDSLIYHNQYEIKSNLSASTFINGFLVTALEYHQIVAPHYEYLFSDTGYWCITENKISKYGIGVRTLNNNLNNSNQDFSICYGDTYNVVIISKKHEFSDLYFIDLYVYNEFYPFSELIEPYQKTCRNYGGKMIKETMLNEKNIRNIWISKKGIKINPICYFMDGNYKMLPFIKNPFKKINNTKINKLEYISGTAIGGFIESDYNNVEYKVTINYIDLSPVVVYNITFYEIKNS